MSNTSKSVLFNMRVTPQWRRDREAAREQYAPGLTMTDYLKRMIEIGEYYYIADLSHLDGEEG